MTTPELLLYILAVVFVVVPLIFLWRLKRKYDLMCFIFAYYISEIFIILIGISIVIGNLELMSSAISSLVIALLTLALVWVELSKRPELALLRFVPLLREMDSGTGTMEYLRPDRGKQLSILSRFLGIKEASYSNSSLKFDGRFSFDVDLANIGYEEISVYECNVYLDSEKKKQFPLYADIVKEETLSLKTQQRHTIDTYPLSIEKSGFHSMRIEVLAATVKCSKTVWFYTSEDLSVLRYVEMYPLKRLLSPLIKKILKDC